MQVARTRNEKTSRWPKSYRAFQLVGQLQEFSNSGVVQLLRIERVAVDASPLIILFKSGLADLLPQLFSEITVRDPVWEEILAGSVDDPATLGLPHAKWATRRTVTQIPETITAWDLGIGESSVLAIAMEHPDARALVDDRAARNCAKALGIRVLGTVGVLLLARRRGLIGSVRDALARIVDAGCWLSEDVKQTVLDEAGGNSDP